MEGFIDEWEVIGRGRERSEFAEDFLVDARIGIVVRGGARCLETDDGIGSCGRREGGGRCEQQ